MSALQWNKAQYTVTEVVNHTQTFTMRDWQGASENFEQIRAEWLANGEAIRHRYPGHDFVPGDYDTNVTNITEDALRAMWRATKSDSPEPTVLNWSCNSTSILATEAEKLAWLQESGGWIGLYHSIVTPTWADIVCKLAKKFATKRILWLCYDREVSSSDAEFVFDEYKDKWRVEHNRCLYAFQYQKIVEVLKQSAHLLQGSAQDTLLCALVKMVNLIYRSGYVAADGDTEMQMVCNLATAVQYFAPIFSMAILKYREEENLDTRVFETSVGTISVGKFIEYNGDDMLVSGIAQMVNSTIEDPLPRLFSQEYNDRGNAIGWMMMEVDFEGRTAYHNRLYLISAGDPEKTRNTQSLFEEFGTPLLMNDDRLSEEKKALFLGEAPAVSKYLGPVNNQYGTGDHLASWEVNIPLAQHSKTVQSKIALKVGKGWNVGDSNTATTRIIKGGNVGKLMITENGLTKIVWTKGIGSIMRTIRRIKEIAGLTFRIVLEDREHRLEGVEHRVANLVLAGCYGKGPALWLIQQIATGRLLVSRSSTCCLRYLAPTLSEESAASEHIDTFLSLEVASELSVISDGRHVYSMVREDGRAMRLERGPLKTFQTKKVRLDMKDLGNFERFRLARPRMIG